jgi:hypothetical protein
VYFRSFLATAAALALLAGCAIHPLPEDVTGVNTYHIVRQIRCETRAALRGLLFALLNKMASKTADWPADPNALQVLAYYQGDPEGNIEYEATKDKKGNTTSIVFIERTIDEKGKPVVSRFSFSNKWLILFMDAGIGYSFDLTMSENNDLTGGTGDFVRPLPLQKFTLGIGADATRLRSNNRTFTVTDKFGDLLSKLNESKSNDAGEVPHYCDGFIVQANYVYPIAGKIGVEEVVRSFLDLTLFANLASGDKSKPTGPPTMAENLTFTTTVDLSATPKISFTPIGTSLQVMDGFLTGKLTRTDQHKVAIGLAIADADAATLATSRAYMLAAQPSGLLQANGQRVTAGAYLLGSRVIARGSPSEILAVLAIDQLKSREIQIVTTP